MADFRCFTSIVQYKNRLAELASFGFYIGIGGAAKQENQLGKYLFFISLYIIQNVSRETSYILIDLIQLLIYRLIICIFGLFRLLYMFI